MKNLPKLLFLGLFLSLVFLFPKTAQAEDLYKLGTTLLFDDFSDGNFNGWTVESGTWTIDSGKQLTGIRVGKLLSGKISTGGTWDNYQIELDVKNDWGIDESIGFRRTDNNNFYELQLRHAIVPGFYDAPEIILKKTEGSQTSEIFKTKNINLVSKTFYHIKIEAFEEYLKLTIDNNVIFDLRDNGTKVKTGGMFLSYWTGDFGFASVRFDNIKVTSLSKLLYPVIFIPGIGGSELKIDQDFYWEKDNGHGGIYSHQFKAEEKVWVNQDEAIKIGDDDYFDVLRLKTDGQTSEAPISLTGNLTPLGYPDIDSFFSSLGYQKGTNYFVFPYDWRKDIKNTAPLLDSLIDEAKTKSGMGKVNIVAHSMGGLVARNYIIDTNQASKVNKLIELGVPHLGAVKALKAQLYGVAVEKKLLGIFGLGVERSEVKDLFFNLPSAYSLQPTSEYFSFYDNSDEKLLYPFFDDRDIDNNKEIGSLNFSKMKTLLTNLKYNMNLFSISEQLHNILTPNLNKDNGVKLFNIVGSGQATLGQIREGWLINWPLKLVPWYDEVYINGDETVPLYSASLKSDAKDLSGTTQIYYVNQVHTDLVASSGDGMKIVKQILLSDDVPILVESSKAALEGQQLSVDQDTNIDLYDENNNHTGLNSNGEIETNIPGTFLNTLGNTKHVFIKKSAPKIEVQITSSPPSQTNLKIRQYKEDKIDKTIYYNNISTSSTPIKILINPAITETPSLSSDSKVILASSEASGSAALDQSPPKTTISLSGNQDSSGNYISEVTVTISSADSSSGVLQTQYSLDDGKTVKIYTEPFNNNTSGDYNLQVSSTDKVGNQEVPKTAKFTIKLPAILASSSDSNSSSGSSNSSDTSTSSITPTSSVLGVNIQNPLSSIKNIFEDKSEPNIISQSEVKGVRAKIDQIEPQNTNKPYLVAIVILEGIVVLVPVFLVVNSLLGNSVISGYKPPK